MYLRVIVVCGFWLAGCSGTEAEDSRGGPFGPNCTYKLNEVRTTMDGDLDCAGAPQLVACEAGSIQAKYLPDGRLAQFTSEGPESANVQREDGRLTSFFSRRFVYDVQGRLESVSGYRFFFYDELDRLIRIEDPGGFHGTTTFEWLANGHLASLHSDLNSPGTAGLRQTFEQDDTGRLIRHSLYYNGKRRHRSLNMSTKVGTS